MVAARVRDYLSMNNAVFTYSEHSKTYTALAEAREDHTPARELAKTVVVYADGRYILAVLAANTRIDWLKLKDLLAASDVRLATEKEMAKLFPDVEAGAVPPLGEMYNMPVYVDEHLTHEPEIASNAGTHTDTVHMAYRQFERLTSPLVRLFATKAS